MMRMMPTARITMVRDIFKIYTVFIFRGYLFCIAKIGKTGVFLRVSSDFISLLFVIYII